MSRIESLEIFGFKSFCDKTQITFEQKITAIVGPNGCGKSNIADAIGWVLGEQSARALRAGRMEDIIFNGTQTRKPINVAEVTLKLNGFHSRALPEELTGEEGILVISRRLYRSGESEYFLNGKPCRLRDIREIFEGTGLGPVSYALIEQGKIDEILNAKPQDRRAFIEEAARITLYKSKRKAAELKLEASRQNLARVNDIILEVRRQLSSLKRQAAKARRYFRLSDELRFYSQIKYYNDFIRLSDEIRTYSAKYDALSEKAEKLSEELTELEEHKRQAHERICSMEEALAKAKDALTELQLEAERVSSLQTYQQEQLAALSKRLDEAREAEALLSRRIDAACAELAKGLEMLAAVQDEISAIEGESRTICERCSAVSERMRALSSEIERLRTSTYDQGAQLAELKTHRLRLNDNCAFLEAQLERLAQEQAKVTSDLEKLKDRSRQAQRAVESMEGRILKRIDELSSAQSEAARLERSLSEKEAKLRALEDELSGVTHRLASLEEIEARRANYAEGVQSFLRSASSLPRLKVRGTLADHIETDRKYEPAVEAFLADQLQYVLVEDLEDALAAVNHLKEIRAGRCTFLVLNGAKSEAQPEASMRPELNGSQQASEVLGFLDELLAMRQEIRAAFARAFPDVRRVVVVTDLEVAFRLARNHPGFTFLTLEGEVFSPRGIISAVGERKAEAGLLSLKRERRDLEARGKELKSHIEALRRELAEARENFQRQTDITRRLAEEVHMLELELAGLRYAAKQLDQEEKRLVEQKAALDIEFGNLSEQRRRAQEQLRQMDSAIAGIESAERSRDQQIEASERELGSLVQEHASLRDRLSELKILSAAKSERRRALDSEIKRISGYEAELRERAGRIERDIQEMVARIRELNLLSGELDGRLRDLSERRSGIQIQIAKIQSDLVETRELAAQLERRIELLRSRREETLAERSQVEVARARCETDLEHLERNCLEEFRESLDSVMARLSDQQRSFDPDLAAANLARIKGRLERFGAINMNALEEYRRLDERYRFLESQRADIERSIADAERAIAEINRRSIERFQEAFDQVNRHFQELFTILFGGGHCQMRLIDEQDVLESGIEIIAQPPGKRLQNILLLSGGEKALVALALLLALFKYRPSPFCVLDEVDAQLDDANIARFTRLIAEMSRQTQFILITHNKRTMEMAEALYGVTMEEPGVSKIVSVKLN